ncbi:MAG: chloride channel protein [Ardenticatenaceae bacterium]|nr:chloride channel protein [Ardenticatenaceae bacterium]
MFGLSQYFDPQERRLVVQSVVIGIVVWVVVYALKTAVHEVSHEVLHFVETQPPPLLVFFVLLFLVIGAVVVATLARTTGRVIHYRDDEGRVHELIDIEGDGLERAISLYYASEPTFEQSLLGDEGVDVRWKLPTFSLALRKAVATLFTIGSGGSGGLEASVTLIGESLSAGLFKPRRQLNGRFSRLMNWWRPTDPDDLQTAQLSGISAAVATLLGAPFTAAFFATEVMYRKRPVIEKLIYSLISALVAFFLNNFAHSFLEEGEGFSYFGDAALFEVGVRYLPPLNNWHYYVLLLGMTLSIALMSIIFGRLRAAVEDWLHHQLTNTWVRHIGGAIATGLIALGVYGLIYFLGAQGMFGLHTESAPEALSLVLGTGESVIDAALAGELLLLLAVVALLAKMLATMITIGSGGSAGLLIPSLFFGTMVATIFVEAPALLGASAEWDFSATPLVFIAPAMTASLVSIVNVPLAAMLFAIEIFSGSYIVPSLMALVIAALFAHQTSIYRTQRERYDQRQILPGYGSRRVPIPDKWDGKTVVDLNLRQTFDVNVIGWVDRQGDDGMPRVRLSAGVNRPLHRGDILVVIGLEGDLDRLQEEIDAPAGARPPAEESEEEAIP